LIENVECPKYATCMFLFYEAVRQRIFVEVKTEGKANTDSDAGVKIRVVEEAMGLQSEGLETVRDCFCFTRGWFLRVELELLYCPGQLRHRPGIRWSLPCSATPLKSCCAVLYTHHP
jgi:hypothetical protein